MFQARLGRTGCRERQRVVVRRGSRPMEEHIIRRDVAFPVARLAESERLLPTKVGSASGGSTHRASLQGFADIVGERGSLPPPHPASLSLCSVLVAIAGTSCQNSSTPTNVQLNFSQQSSDFDVSKPSFAFVPGLQADGTFGWSVFHLRL